MMSRYAENMVEIKRPVVFRQKSRQKAKPFCPVCQNNIEMLSANKAALKIGCRLSAIFGWIELGWLHFTESNEGLRVCSHSLGKIITIKN